MKTPEWKEEVFPKDLLATGDWQSYTVDGDFAGVTLRRRRVGQPECEVTLRYRPPEWWENARAGMFDGVLEEAEEAPPTVACYGPATLHFGEGAEVKLPEVFEGFVARLVADHDGRLESLERNVADHEEDLGNLYAEHPELARPTGEDYSEHLTDALQGAKLVMFQRQLAELTSLVGGENLSQTELNTLLRRQKEERDTLGR